jgi:hypothetical protein
VPTNVDTGTGDAAASRLGFTDMISASPKNILGHPTTWRRWILLFAAAVALCVWGLTAIVIIDQREAALGRARADATNLSAAFEEQIRLVMNAAHTLALVRRQLELGDLPTGSVPRRFAKPGGRQSQKEHP